MVCYTIPSIFFFSSIFQLKSILLCENLVIKALTNLMAHFIFLPLINLNQCVIYVVYACTYKLGISRTVLSRGTLSTLMDTYPVDIMLFCLRMSSMLNKRGACEFMELYICVRETAGPLA